jgi:hypothetical protein
MSNSKDSKKKPEDSKEPPKSRWDLDSYKRMDQDKGIYDWSRKNY